MIMIPDVYIDKEKEKKMQFINEVLTHISTLGSNLMNLADWRYIVMWAIGGILIFLAIAKKMEPTLLLPMGFGAILVNIPLSGAIDKLAADGTILEEGDIKS